MKGSDFKFYLLISIKYGVCTVHVKLIDFKEILANLRMCCTFVLVFIFFEFHRLFYTRLFS